MQADAVGLELTTDSAEAAHHYQATIAEFFEYRLSTADTAKLILEADPQFVMGQCLRGYLLLILGTVATVPKVRGVLDGLAPRLAGVTSRERQHVKALEAWSRGDIVAACRAWENILAAHPHDLLALRLHHFNMFWTGRNHAMLSTVAGVVDAWDESLPGYGNVLGMFAFSLEECGEYEAALKQGRRALEVNGDDLWSIHAVAHVLDMQGRADEGLEFLDRPADAWEDRNPFQGHLWWHRALFHIFKGEYEQVLALYDERIRAANTALYLDIQNMGSLLKRLELQGVSVGERWQELADYVEERIGDHVLPFTDAHCCFSLAAAGRAEAAGRFIESLRRFGKTPDNYAASTISSVTLPLCEALIAYEAGDHAGATDRLMPLRHALSAIGGSHEQRDLFSQILADAAWQSRRLDLARFLYSERVVLKPHSLGDWRRYGEVLGALGDEAGAERAKQKAATLH